MNRRLSYIDRQQKPSLRDCFPYSFLEYDSSLIIDSFKYELTEQLFLNNGILNPDKRKHRKYRQLFVEKKENKLLSILARICLVPHCIDAMMWLWTLLIDVCTTKWKKGRKMERMKEKKIRKKGKLNQRWNSLSLMWHFRHLKSVFRCFLRTHRDLIYLKRIMCSSLRKIFD